MQYFYLEQESIHKPYLCPKDNFPASYSRLPHNWRPLAYIAHLEGVAFHFNYVVHNLHSWCQRVGAGKHGHVAKCNYHLQVVIKSWHGESSAIQNNTLWLQSYMKLESCHDHWDIAHNTRHAVCWEWDFTERHLDVAHIDMQHYKSETLCGCPSSLFPSWLLTLSSNLLLVVNMESYVPTTGQAWSDLEISTNLAWLIFDTHWET